MNLRAFLFVAAAMTAQAAAKFTVTSGTTKATTSSTKHVNFVKQWTLNSAAANDIIDSIDLDLAGRVYVSYVSGLPSGVLGYVNVSGDSQAIVDAVTVSNDDRDDHNDRHDRDDYNDNDDKHDKHDTDDHHDGHDREDDHHDRPDTDDHHDNDETDDHHDTLDADDHHGRYDRKLRDDNHDSDDRNDRNDINDISDNDGELNVRLGNSASTTLSGYLLTEITLASTGVVNDLKSRRSAQVVVEDGVLVTSSTTAELQVEAVGSSAVYVSAANTAVSVRQLHLDVSDTASVALIASSLEAVKLDLDAQNTGTICISAKQVTATTYEGRDASRISMPNAASKYDSTGSSTCEEASLPAREAACVSSGCATSSTSGTTANGGTNAANSVPGIDTANVSTSASSIPQLAVLAAAAIGVAIASLL